MKKQIAIIEPLSPKGHLDINKVALGLLKKEYEVYYFAANYYKEVVTSDIHPRFYPDSFFENHKSPLSNRIRYYKVFKRIIKDIKLLNDIKCIIVMSYELLTTALLIKKLTRVNRNVYLFNHNNVDETSSSFIKRICFKHIFKNANAIVYEQFIKDYVYDIFRINSFIVRHNLNLYKTSGNKIDNCNLNKTILITSLSGNTLGQDVIDQIINADKAGLLLKSNIHFFIKDKRVDYHSGNVDIVNKYLTDDEYSRLMALSSFNMLLYNETYLHRVSGVYFDSISFKKPVVYYGDNLFLSDQSKRFGEIGIRFQNVEQLVERINNSNYNDYLESIEKVFGFYSDDRVFDDYNRIIINKQTREKE